jgi:hypothetical protein
MIRAELDFSFPQLLLLRSEILHLRKNIHNQVRSHLLRLRGHHLRVFFGHMKAT